MGSSEDLMKSSGHHHHHHHHHKHHHKGYKHHKNKSLPKTLSSNTAGAATPKVAIEHNVTQGIPANASDNASDASIVGKMRKLEEKIAKKKSQGTIMGKGHLLVNGPLPADFGERFVQAVSFAIGVEARDLKFLDATATKEDPNVVEINFRAPLNMIKSIQDEAADSDSKLAQGDMHSFLVAKDDDEASSGATSFLIGKQPSPQPVPGAQAEDDATPVRPEGIDIDTAMPYGDLEPFGREDTAQELTEDSIKESDGMVDQLERAEVSEEKRAVFRALTRLRGAAITSFDGIARSQTGNIDEYNKVHQWRNTHPLHHLADEESDVSKWAFPDNADF
jgi:hypothetical protein